MKGKLPNFKEEAALAYNAAKGDGDPFKDLESHLRQIFAEGMKHATERIKNDEGLDFSCWIHEEADMVEKGKA